MSTIGRELGFDNAHIILDQNIEKELDFLNFFSIIKFEMLDKIKAESEESKLLTRPDFTQIHRVCWMLCSNKSLSKNDQTAVKVDPITGVVLDDDEDYCNYSDKDDGNLNDDNAFKLWRIFNFLVESDGTGNPSIPLRLDVEEAVYLCKRFSNISGQLRKEKQLHLISEVKDEVTFELFSELFVKPFIEDICPEARTCSINLLYEQVVLDTIKKVRLYIFHSPLKEASDARGHGLKPCCWQGHYLVRKLSVTCG